MLDFSYRRDRSGGMTTKELRELQALLKESRELPHTVGGFWEDVRECKHCAAVDRLRGKLAFHAEDILDYAWRYLDLQH
jgi:hypothetical protein